MIKTVYKIVCLSIFLFSSCLLFSQDVFPEKPDAFCEEFCNSLDKIRLDGKEGKELAESFELFWTSDTLSLDEKDDFIETANLLVTKGAREWPHLFIYAENMMLFYRHGFDSGQYHEWRNGLITLLKERNYINAKKISEYQLYANDILRDSVMFRHARITWKVSQFPDNIGYNEDDGVYIRFSNLNIYGLYGNDSLIIKGTSGTAYPMDEKWKGQYGKVTWERVLLSPDSVYADLNNYQIDLTKTKYTADSARFVNLNYFDEALYGTLEDKALNIDNPTKSSYPRFSTYTKKFKMENVLEGIDYEGGFNMKGQDFMGIGLKDQKARIIIAKSDTIKMVAKSESFTLDPKRIFSKNTDITLHLSEDSIYHPNLIMKYSFKNKLLTLERDKEGMSKVNFTNSYHKLHMDFTLLQWHIEKYKMQFGIMKSMSEVNEAFFESADFFSEKKYRDIQVRDQVHPFVRLENFVQEWGESEFKLNDFARY
ncbi:MAG: hypothetical protein R6V32_00160, partial [Bacteroidales bacterium]